MANFFVLAVQTLTELRVSLQRIDKFLATPEPPCPATVTREEAMRHAQEEAARQSKRGGSARRTLSKRAGPGSTSATSRSSSMARLYNAVEPLSRQVSIAIGRGMDLMMRISRRFGFGSQRAPVQQSVWIKWESGYVAMRGADYDWSRPFGFGSTVGFHPDCQAAGADEKVGRHARQPTQNPGDGKRNTEPAVTLVMAQSHPGNAIRPGSSEEGPGGGKGSGDENPPSTGVADGAAETDGSCSSGGLTLYGIRFDAAPGELVGICGTVGSGKSSLLAALLGELQPLVQRDGKDGGKEEHGDKRRRTKGSGGRQC
ncbi:hypothetical protein Vretimale_5668, partial [Volvox reticuliferus]